MHIHIYCNTRIQILCELGNECENSVSFSLESGRLYTVNSINKLGLLTNELLRH